MLPVVTYFTLFADLKRDPNSELYNAPTYIVGSLNSNGPDGVYIRLLTDDFTTSGIKPQDYFEVYDGDKGIMMRMVRGIDRDVCWRFITGL